MPCQRIGRLFIAAAVIALPPATTGSAQTVGPVSRLEILLTSAETLPAAARDAMMVEASAIWLRQGVTITWLSPTAIRTGGAKRLRVLVVEQRPEHTLHSQFSVGELVRPPGSHPIALVSIAGARRLMASVQGRAGYELITVDDRRLGLVLGRALAHEIGHYLLNTHTHARSGLMRPHFSALEFTDLREDTFALDEAAAAWLRRSAATEAFAYARP
jgi:hypothetical protein